MLIWTNWVLFSNTNIFLMINFYMGAIKKNWNFYLQSRRLIKKTVSLTQTWTHWRKLWKIKSNKQFDNIITFEIFWVRDEGRYLRFHLSRHDIYDIAWKVLILRDEFITIMFIVFYLYHSFNRREFGNKSDLNYDKFEWFAPKKNLRIWEAQLRVNKYW